MDKIISKEEINKIMPFKYSSDILYFPVRHHSPVCSVQLLRVIEEYQPDCVLIEGPENASHMMEFLASEETKFPVAMYYSYKDSKKLVDEEEEARSYSCYYPLLEYSPELVAIKKAVSDGVAVKFIDLPFAKRLVSTENYIGVRKRLDKNNYSDDYLISSTNIAKALCEKTGFTNFDSFWDAHFEVNGLELSPEEFVTQFNTYTYLLRKGSNEHDLIADSTIIREQFMAEEIEKAKQSYSKILVVTGGFHTYGLMHPKEGEKLPYSKTKADDESIYLMPYSMEEADAINGYASGMVSPGFYQTAWEELKNGNRKAYETTVLNLILKTAKECKKKKMLITMSDEASAFNIAEGLALLRGKSQCGKDECRDGIISSFIKGELNPATELPLDILGDFFTGNRIGDIPKNSPTPPIVKDFMERAKFHRLKIDNSVRKEITLSVFAKGNHREISRFFHTLKFLNTDFCNQKRGSNLIDSKDRNIIREIWEYRFAPMVVTRLIEQSVHGATISSAAYHILADKIKEASSASDCAKLLIDCFLMGINDKLELLKQKTIDTIALDDDFFSCGEALYHLSHIYRLREFYGERDNLDYIKLIELCFGKTLSTLEYVKNCNEDMEQQAIKNVKLLFDIASKEEFKHFKESILETFIELVYSDLVNPTLLGAMQGILYAMGNIGANVVTYSFNTYLASNDEAVKGARFLSGVFYTARDIIFVGEEFLSSINKLISTLSSEDFIIMLPDFKMTFSYFTPSEIDRISKSIAKMFSFDGNLLDKLAIDEQDLIYGELLNRYLLEELGEV